MRSAGLLRSTAAIVAASAVCIPVADAATRPRTVLANHCFALRAKSHLRFVNVAGADRYGTSVRSKAKAARFFLKPTGLGTYMLYDGGRRLMAVEGSSAVGRAGTPGPQAEWRPLRVAKHAFAIRSTSNRRDLAVARSGDLVLVAAGSGGRASRFG